MSDQNSDVNVLLTAGQKDMPTVYKEVMEQIKDLDETLDALSDTKSAGKRATKNAIMQEFESAWKEKANGVVNGLKNIADEKQRWAIYYGFVETLTKAFNDEADNWVEKIVDSQPKVERPNLTAQQIADLSTKRSTLYKTAKSIREMATLFGFNADEFEAPRRRGGGFGLRGPRAISEFDWSVDGRALEGDNNKLTFVAKTYGFKDVAELRDAIAKATPDPSDPTKTLDSLKDPPDRLTFTLPNGSILMGQRDRSKQVSADDPDAAGIDPDLDAAEAALNQPDED